MRSSAGASPGRTWRASSSSSRAARSLTLANPMSSEQSQLRGLLLGSLLDVAERNRARGADAIRIFESGAVYRAKAISADNLPEERHHLGALLSGPVRRSTWREQRPPRADFFAAKGVLAGAARGDRRRVGCAAERSRQGRAGPLRRSCTQVVPLPSSSTASRSAGSERSIRTSPPSGTSTTPSPASRSSSRRSRRRSRSSSRTW